MLEQKIAISLLTKTSPLIFFFLAATFAEAVERFNSNIPYNGLLHAVTQDVSTVCPGHLCLLLVYSSGLAQS